MKLQQNKVLFEGSLKKKKTLSEGGFLVEPKKVQHR
jgi:hypothetical protein